MGNCLVTKLKGEVQNDNLPMLGILEIQLKATTTRCQVSFEGVSPFTIEIKGSGHFYDGQNNDLGQKITNYNNTGVYINNTADNDKLVISDKYQLLRLYVNDMVEFMADGAIFDAGFLVKMQTFFPYTQLISVDLNTLAKYSKDLQRIVTVYNTYATGSIEKMTENILAQGRNSGTLRINVYSTPVTFHDEIAMTSSANDYYVDFSSGSAIVRWGDTQVASYNGSTWTYNS